MTFASPIFLYWFLPLALALYALLPARSVAVLDPFVPRSLAALPSWLFSKTGALTLLSLLFYGWWRPSFLPLLLASAWIDWAIGRGLGVVVDPRRRKLLVALSCVVNLGVLAWFKYADFGAATAAALLGDSAPAWLGSWEKTILPVGISFYTFQSMSYVIDVYRGVARPTRNAGDFLGYVALFPQLVAGPVVRYADVADEFRSRTHTPAKIAAGLLLVQIGFAKKILLADVAAGAADGLFGTAASGIAGGALANPGFFESWIGSVAYAFQIYFDFSGYSDMAVGLGLLFGFRFPINFDAPYRSASLAEFWRRWHVTLSSWLRDYLYIPLGGSRSGAARTYVNLGLTMLLGGLWHGAQWTFLAWGAYHGFWLCVERAAGEKNPLLRAPRVVQVAFTFVVVCVGWVFFRARTFADAFEVLGGMAGLNGLGGGMARLGCGADAAVPAALIAAACAVWGARTSTEQATAPTLVGACLIPLAFLAAAGHRFFQRYAPFLYSQF